MRLHSIGLVLIAAAIVFISGFFLGRQSLLVRSQDLQCHHAPANK